MKKKENNRLIFLMILVFIFIFTNSKCSIHRKITDSNTAMYNYDSIILKHIITTLPKLSNIYVYENNIDKQNLFFYKNKIINNSTQIKKKIFRPTFIIEYTKKRKCKDSMCIIRNVNIYRYPSFFESDYSLEFDVYFINKEKQIRSIDYWEGITYKNIYHY